MSQNILKKSIKALAELANFLEYRGPAKLARFFFLVKKH
jgi:hypothetical protein